MTGRILAVVVALALVAGVAYRVQHQEAAESKKAGGEARALSVKTVPVEVRDFPRVLDLPGTLEAQHQAAITAQVGGTLLKQHVREGETVRAGQLLFTLDARPAQARMAQSQASLTGAQAQTADAEKKVERLKPLLQTGYISQQEYDDARLTLESARAGVGTSRAELEAARLDAQYAQIRAPFAGRIGSIAVRPGDLVQAGGEALTTLRAPGALEARASVAQQDWPALAAARAHGKVPVEIFHDTDSTVLAHGELVFVDTQLDAASGAVPVKVSVRDPSPVLLSGQSVRVRLLLGVEPAARVVPEAALQHGQAGSYVYVVRDTRAVVQPVTLLRALDGQLAVRGDLRPGERVLIEIPQRLKAGSQVRLENAGGEQKKQGSPTGAGPRS